MLSLSLESDQFINAVGPIMINLDYRLGKPLSMRAPDQNQLTERVRALLPSLQISSEGGEGKRGHVTTGISGIVSFLIEVDY